MASTYLTRTAGTGSRRKFTTSLWVKRSKVGSPKQDLIAYNKSPNYNIEIQFQADDTFRFYSYNNSSTTVDLITNRKFRDVNGWYHIVLAVDTEQAVEANRFKIYINGVQETSFSTADYPSLNEDLQISHGETIAIGAWATSGDYFDGYMSYVIFIDGTQYAASDFGETDSNGVWTIKTSPSVTYGTNGFFILKNGNSVTDQSGNGNNFTVAAGTLTDDKDSPSNVFNTYNQLTIIGADPTLSNGGTTVSSTTGNHWRTTNSNIGMSSGKYYWETKFGTISGGNYCRNGVVSENLIGTQTTSVFVGNYAYGIDWYGDKLVNSTLTAYTTVATGDIFMFALDLDNNFIYGGRNGTWIGSGDPTSGASGTNALSAVQSGQTYFVSASVYQSSQDTNFGNGYFGTTAISSAGTNASNNGVFEYDVPTGYTALCTKGLNE